MQMPNNVKLATSNISDKENNTKKTTEKKNKNGWEECLFKFL